MTAATQNVEECLRSDTARYMFANSEYVRLFTQAATDMDELAHLLHISDNQMGYVTNAEPGHGLMKVKGYIIPFDATIPTDGDIYKLINTTPRPGLIRFMLKRINKGVILWQKSAPGRISGNVLIIRIPASAS